MNDNLSKVDTDISSKAYFNNGVPELPNTAEMAQLMDTSANANFLDNNWFWFIAGLILGMIVAGILVKRTAQMVHKEVFRSPPTVVIPKTKNPERPPRSRKPRAKQQPRKKPTTNKNNNNNKQKPSKGRA